METTYTWQDTAAGTQMTLRNRGEPAGFSRLLAPLMTPAMRLANRKDLLRLKEILEASDDNLDRIMPVSTSGSTRDAEHE